MSSSRSNIDSEDGARRSSRSRSGEVGRGLFEDDGDVASQRSEQAEADGNSIYHTDATHAASAAAAASTVSASVSPRPAQPSSSMPTRAFGPRRGALLDGYRLLQASRCELPEQLHRFRLTSCTPPLIDAVPEHLAEFVNLHTLDVSGNSLPFDRFRLMPSLEELNLSCNMIRDFDFSPLPGVHFPVPQDDDDDGYEMTEEERIEMEHLEQDAMSWPLSRRIGFDSLRSLDLAHNFLSQAAIRTLQSLPKLRTLNLSSNSLRTLPITLGSFRTLRQLNLRDNSLGSGQLRRKLLMQQRAEWERARMRAGGSGGHAIGGGVRAPGPGSTSSAAIIKTGPFIPRKTTGLGTTTSNLPIEQLLINDTANEHEHEENDPAEEGVLGPEGEMWKQRPDGNEWRLFRALSLMPCLEELDLSENLLTTIPHDCFTSLPPSSSTAAPTPVDTSSRSTRTPKPFPKLRILNLSCNQLHSEQDTLSLREMSNLQWVDLRHNTFVEEKLAMKKSHRTRGGETTDGYANLFPDLYHVCCQTHISIVLSYPRHAHHSLPPDTSHIMSPPEEEEADVGNVEMSSSRRRPLSGLKSAVERHSARLPSKASERLTKSAGEEKEQLAPSIDHPDDSLQQLLSTSAVSPTSSHRVARAPSDESEYDRRDTTQAEQHDPSNTFLTGVAFDEPSSYDPRVDEDVEHVNRSRAQSALIATTMDSGRRSIPSPSPSPPSAMRSGAAARAALTALLQQSDMPLLEACKPTNHPASQKITSHSAIRSLPRTHVPFHSRSGYGFSTGRRRTGHYAPILQPKVSNAYKNMEEVLNKIEQAYSGSTSAAGASSSSNLTNREEMCGRMHSTHAAQPPRTYIDPQHIRAIDQSRKLRHRQKEKQEIEALLQTVKEVSKSLEKRIPPPSLQPASEETQNR